MPAPAPIRTFEERSYILAGVRCCMRVSLLQLLLWLATGVGCALFVFAGLVTLEGRVESASPDLTRQVISPLDPTRPDPTRPDPTRPDIARGDLVIRLGRATSSKNMSMQFAITPFVGLLRGKTRRKWLVVGCLRQPTFRLKSVG